MTQPAALDYNKNWFTVSIQTAEAAGLMHKNIEPDTPAQANTLQIPIAQAQQIRDICCDPAVSSPEDYPTPAPNADVIRKPLLDGRHLIILNRSRRSRITGFDGVTW